MSRYRVAAFVLAAVTALALAGCGMSGEKSGGATKQASPQSTSWSSEFGADTRKAIASTHVTPSGSDWRDIRVDLVGLNRFGKNSLVVQLRLTNEDSKDSAVVWDRMADFMQRDAKWQWASGIGVLDTASRQLLLPYQTAHRGCLCTGQKDKPGGAGASDMSIAPHKSWTLYAVTPAPSDGARTVTVVTPITPPLVNMPISDDAPVPPPGQQIANPADTRTTAMRYPIETPQESPDKSEEVIDKGKRIEVNLSTDVLFELNKADLSSKAHAVLVRTAKQIDDSDATMVNVDGYTDSSGTDRINDPLSRNRADAVKKALTPLVHRNVRFVAAGHGSRNPLYPNSTAEGRQHNRRVTVSFTKSRTQTTATSSPSPQPHNARTTVTFDGVPFTVDLTGLRRLTDDLGVLTYRLTDNSAKDGRVDLSRAGRTDNGLSWVPLESYGADAVYVVDAAKKLRYPAARFVSQHGRYCACTQTAGMHSYVENFDGHQSKELWTLIELPSPTDKMDVEIGKFPKLTGIPVTP